LHCVWGWRGNCNGYYVSRIFDTTRGAVIPDTGQEGNTETDYYNWAFHIITYDL
jgi:hypothetical protein